MFKKLCRDLWIIIQEIGRSIVCTATSLACMIYYIGKLILFIPVQMLLSIYYILKYIFRNRRRVRHYTDKELQTMLASELPDRYLCLGVRLSNYLVYRYAKKKLETK